MRYAHTRSVSWTTRTLRLVTLAATALIAAGSMLLVFERTATAATSAASYTGTATMADDSGTALSAGASATPFTLNLPAQAACPGDSTTGGYLVDSYLVPQSTNFGTLSFSGGFPSTGYSLYNSTNNKAFAAANTATGTGQIIGIPNTLEFGSQVGHGKPTLANLLAGNGVWEAGIACELSGALTDYWNTEVTFTASTTDVGGGFVWSAVPGPPSGSTTTTSSTAPTTTTTSGSAGTTSTTSGTTSTTTASTDPSASTSTTTTVAVASSSASGGSSTGSTGTGSTFASTGSGSGTSGSGTSGSGTTGTLAFTGLPVGKSLGLGLLAIGIGLILLAWGPRTRIRLATERRGSPR
jgi:hypothetical protein